MHKKDTIHISDNLSEFLNVKTKIKKINVIIHIIKYAKQHNLIHNHIITPNDPLRNLFYLNPDQTIHLNQLPCLIDFHTCSTSCSTSV